MTLVSIPANPVPDNVVSGTIKTPDGAELRFARWQPPAGRKGTVCVFTGRGEFIEKYFETIGELVERGFSVVAMDWRGQGLSARELPDANKGHIDDFDMFERDLEAMGIPCLKIEREYGPLVEEGRIKMRVDAFMEGIQ